MKRVVLVCIPFICYLGFSQAPASTVYDPMNNAELVGIAATIGEMQQQYKQITDRLNTVSQINKMIDVLELLATIEQSACVISDLNYYWNLSKYELSSSSQSNCFGEVNINMAVSSIKNAIATINSAVSSDLFALNERSENIVNSFKVIQESTKELFNVKESLRVGVESEQETNEFLNLLYGKQ